MTKRQEVGRSWASRWRRAGAGIIAIGLLGSLAVLASGCDTVALISFSERTFTGIHSSGFVPSGGSCTGVDGNGEMKVRFVLVDNEAYPIRAGEAVDSQEVQLSSDSMELTSAALMEVHGGGACSGDDVCQTQGYACGLGPGLSDSNEASAELHQCVKDSSLSIGTTPGSVEFVADTSQHQVFGMLVENSGSLDGWNPPGSDGAWDANGDGDTEDDDVDLPPQDRDRIGDPIATDYETVRYGAVRKTLRPWVNAYDLAKSEQRNTYYGLWSFNDAKVAPTSHTAEATATSQAWASDITDLTTAFQKYADADIGYHNRANVYESIEQVIKNDYSDIAMGNLVSRGAEDVDKVLVVVVDGYNDLRNSIDTGLDEAIDAAQKNNVRVFIVHLDPKLEDPSLLREDPEYPIGQPGCDDTSECENFEVCREPKGYSTSKGSPILEPTDYSLDDTFCLPERDEFGRVGPIAEYARLACETRGGYMYTPSVQGLDRNITWTPHILDGLWEATLTSGAIQRGQAPSGEAVRVHANMSVSVSGETRTYPFTQLGDLNSSAESTLDDFDTRGVVFTAE